MKLKLILERCAKENIPIQIAGKMYVLKPKKMQPVHHQITDFMGDKYGNTVLSCSIFSTGSRCMTTKWEHVTCQKCLRHKP